MYLGNKTNTMDLIINSFGTCVGCEQDGFVVHHKDGKQRIPSVGIKSIQLSKGAQISSDAILMAIEKEIDVLFLTRSGEPMGRIWSNKYGSVSAIRKGQLTFTFSKEAINWIKDIIIQKIENQEALLMMMHTPETLLENEVSRSIKKLSDYREKIKGITGEVVSEVAPTLRGWEGVASKIYFQTLNRFIAEEYRFAGRSQHPAMDIVNALLNYGYGILYGKIEGSMIKAGIDPYVGVMHRDDYNRPVLVYDVIEKYRVWVDYVVYTLISQKIITEDSYSIQSDGSVWLESLGKRILVQSLQDYLDEIITLKGTSRSRQNHISIYCQDLAQKFKKNI